MKIKTLKKHRANQTIKTSAGAVTFDGNCEAEIPDGSFDQFKAILKDIVKPGEEPKAEVKTDAKPAKKGIVMDNGEFLGKEDKKAEETESNGDDQLSNEDMKAQMKDLPLKDLKEIALKIPGADSDAIGKMKSKDSVIEFIMKNQK